MDAEDTGDPAPGADPDQNVMLDPDDPDTPVADHPLGGTWLPWPGWARLASIRFSRAAR
jgi:hypothetical protein